MALVLKDRVKETTTSTGTGTINLAGAATGFEGFVSAVGSGNACYYTILDANGSAWEVGIGTVTDAATDTLSRDTILESSNSDSGVSLSSGTHTVFLTYPADKSVYRNTNDQIVATASGIVFSDSTVQTTTALTYTAGSGLELDSTTFNAKTATTSASGITTLTNTIDSTQTKALTPKAVDDAGYGTMSNFILEDGDGTEVTIANAKEVKFIDGSGIDINWTDVSDGSDSDPYDLTFTVDHDAASNFVANEHVDHTSVTLTAGSGLSGGGDISSNRTFNALTATTGVAGITTLTNTINGDQDKALTPKAVNDASYLTSESDTLQTVTGRGAVTTNDVTISGGLTVSHEGAFSTFFVVSSGQKIGFGNRGESGNDGMMTIRLDDSSDDTYTASSGVQVSLNSAKSALAVVPTAADTGIPRTVFNGGASDTRPAGDGVVNIKSLHEDVPNLIVYGKSDGTSHLTEWKDSDGDTVAYIGEKGTLALGKDFHIQKFDSYIATGVGPTDASGVALTFDNASLHQSYSYRIRCHDEDSNRLDGSVFLARKNDDNTGWDVTTVAIQKNAQNEYPIVFDDGGTLKVKTGGVGGPRDITVYMEGIYVNRNDVTGYIWGADSIWSKVSTAGGSLHSIYASGNVGINKEVPAYPLDVNGTGNFAGIRFSDGTTQSTAGGGGSARSVAGDTDNGVITWVTSDNTFAVEAGLTYDAAGTLTATGIIDVTNTLDASDATGDTGAIRTEGGVSIAKKLYVGTDLDVDGTTNLDAVDIDGAVDLAGELKLTGAFVPGAGINAQTDDTSMGLDLSEGNYFEVTLTNGQTPVATIDITNASLGQRFMVRVIQPSNGNIVLDSVGDGWDAVQINSGSRVATKWGGGIGPTLTTGNGSADLYGFVIRGLAGSAAIDGFIIAQDLKAT